jgi:putative nucleotidyltransferase with HDIG domain
MNLPRLNHRTQLQDRRLMYESTLGEITLEKLNRLIEIITDIAGGVYTKDIMELSGPDTEEPVRAIAQALVRMIANVEDRQNHLEMLTKQLEEANQHTRRNIIATVSTMAKALAARDAYTEDHAERVGQISGLIAAELGLSEKDTELVQLAGLLHDIGKIGFPDYLFLPHEGNTPKEIVREITRHPTTSAEILKDIDFLSSALPYIRYHHERPDGQGYPNNLKDAEIPLGARIISVADAFDAITTDRPYQKAGTFQEALAILKKGAGTKWDPECVSACERILPEIPFHARTVRVPKEKLLCLSDNHPEIVLEQGPVGGARMRWLKPGIDFSKYDSLILDRVTFFFAPDSEYKGMDPQELKELADLFKRQLVDSLKKKYHIVKDPGSDVARIRFAITDLRQNRPVLNDLGTMGLDLSDFKMALMNSWSDTGATSTELMIFDSMTNSPIAAAKDDQKVGLKEKFTKWGSAEDAFKYWADKLRLFLDQARDVKE